MSAFFVGVAASTVFIIDLLLGLAHLVGHHGAMTIRQRVKGTDAALFTDPVLLAGKSALLGESHRLRGGHDRIVDARQEDPKGTVPVDGRRGPRGAAAHGSRDTGAARVRA